MAFTLGLAILLLGGTTIQGHIFWLHCHWAWTVESRRTTVVCFHGILACHVGYVESRSVAEHFKKLSSTKLVFLVRLGEIIGMFNVIRYQLLVLNYIQRDLSKKDPHEPGKLEKMSKIFNTAFF